MNGRLKSKKGFMQDVAYAIVIVFAIVIIILVINKVFKQIEPVVHGSEEFNDSEVIQHFDAAQARFVPITDSVALILLIGFALTAIMLVVFLDTHPAFFWITLFILIFIAVIGGILANAYQTIATNSTLADSASDFTIIPFIFEHYVQLILAIGGLVLAGLFIKGRSGGVT